MTTSFQPRAISPEGIRPERLRLRPVAGLVAVVAVVAGLVVLGEAAWSGTDSAPLPFAPSGSAPIAAAPALVDTGPPVAFGTVHTWSDGATISVGSPQPFESPTAFAPTGLARAVSAPVTLTAGATPFDLSTLTFEATAAAQPAGALFDAGYGITDVTVPAGGVEKVTMLFAIPVEESTPLSIRVGRAFATGPEAFTVAGPS